MYSSEDFSYRIDAFRKALPEATESRHGSDLTFDINLAGFSFEQLLAVFANLWEDGESADTQVALQDLATADGLCLDRLEVTLLGFGEGFRGVDVQLGFAGQWEIADRISLTLQSLRVKVTPQRSLIDVRAIWHLDTLDLKVAVELPDLVIEAALSTSEPENDQNLQALSRLGALPDVPRTSARLDDLSIVVAPLIERGVFHLEVENLFEIGHHAMTLETLEIEAVYEGGLAGHPSGHAGAVLRLALSDELTVGIDLSAAVGASGWSFSGAVRAPERLSLGEVASVISGSDANAIPSFLANIALEEIFIAYETSQGALSAGLALEIGSDGARIVIRLERNADGSFDLSGTLTVDGARFTLEFLEQNGKSALIFQYASEGCEPFDLMRLASVFTGSTLPGVHLQIESAYAIAMEKDEVLMAPELRMGLDQSALAGIPFVGALLPATARFGLSISPVLLHAHDRWDKADYQIAQRHAPTTTDLPPDLPTSRLSGKVRIDLGARHEETGVAFDPVAAKAGSSARENAGGASDDAPPELTWVDVDQSIGPLSIARIGFKAEATEEKSALSVDLRMDAALAFAGLSLSAEGLGLSFSVDNSSNVRLGPPRLSGLGIDYSKEPLKFGGAFLQSGDDFAGAVSISTEAFSLHADGALSMIGHTPSMFIYGVLDYPIGGPAFFFVEGLAAGFGLNRRLTPPALKDVKRFPLVADAISVQKKKPDLADKLNRLHEYIEPSLGEYFFAAGVRFTSFKVIDSFVLLILRAGEHVEIDLIGTATYQTPPPPASGLPTLARIGMDVLGHFAPDDGVISVQARLSDDSFIYSGLCKITGGFAFASWYKGEHAGDFVICVGGYHPKFRKPAHYPSIDPIRLTYQISPNCSISGSAYFAMTPSALMAGGSFHARAHASGVQAWFDLTVDFIVYWEPYHYDAHAHVDIGVKYGWFKAQLSADLHLWGPPFAGKAHVKWAIFSFDVKIGVKQIGAATPISWIRFRQAYLPREPHKATSVRMISGLTETRRRGTTEIWVVNPAAMALGVSSTLPVSSILLNEAQVKLLATRFGIAPSDRLSAKNELRVTFRRVGAEDENPPLRALAKETGFPSALWAEGLKAARKKSLVKAGSGVEIRTRELEPEVSIPPFPLNHLNNMEPAYPPKTITGVAEWNRSAAPATKDVALGLSGPDAAELQRRRADFLARAGFGAGDVTLGKAYTDSLRGTPITLARRSPT